MVKRRSKWKSALIGLVFLATATTALVPSLREGARGLLRSDNTRQVLSTARAEFLGDDLFLVIVKVQTPEGIFLEIYETIEQGRDVLLDKVLLPYDRDGWIFFKDQHSNLILYDVTGDGRPEFLVPTFDPLRTPHLSVYRLDLETKTLRLEPWSPAAAGLPF